jgi:DNA-binding CsgD family transcriptional regulator
MAALDERTGIALRVEALAWIAGAAGDVERAARLLGAADAVWTSIPSSPPDPMRSRRDVCAERACASLGHALFERLRRQGAAMSRDEAIAYALKRRRVPRSNTLSRREDEVAQLLAAGLSDREIAAELVISIRTAQSHVSHILTKLRLRSRSQVAATWAPPRS